MITWIMDTIRIPNTDHMRHRYYLTSTGEIHTSVMLLDHIYSGTTFITISFTLRKLNNSKNFDTEDLTRDQFVYLLDHPEEAWAEYLL